MLNTLPTPTFSTEIADTALATLTQRKHAWVQVSIPERIAYLQRCIESVLAVAEPWAEAACRAKGIDPHSALAGEEWIAGPAAVLLNLRRLIQTLEAKGQPQPVNLSTSPNGQQVAQVFPTNWMDKLLWLGFRGEVWIEPEKPATQGSIYRAKSSPGKLALVLGAGNISSIAPMDALYKLFAEDQVVLLKMNPVNEYMGALLEQAFHPLVADGFFEVVYGGAEVGSYLCHHPLVDTVHVTGSHRTHDAIVWGNTPEEQQQRKAANQPLLNKPITSELGCVTPVFVVPGRWSKADLKFQARQIASMVAHNASFNCLSAKVVVTAQGWEQRQEFLQQLHQELAKIPRRQAYYPGAQQRYQAFVKQYPQAIALPEGKRQVRGKRQKATGKGSMQDLHSAISLPWTPIPDVPAQAGEYALTEEAFCGVLAEVALDAADAKSFLAQAVEFANEKVWGTLSCVVLIDPATQRNCATELQEAIAQLRYGGIGINVWSGIVYFMGVTSWGAFPGNALSNIGSGRGVVHNTYLFDHPQKSVLYAPFRIRPTPIWFADHKNLWQLAQGFARLQASPTWQNFLRVVVAAFRG